MRLFDQDGYDATTLEAVAAAAGVSARTFFNYFQTKYSILEYWHDLGFERSLPLAILEEPAGEGPFVLVQACLLKLVPLYDTDTLVILDRIRNSTDTLRADKQMVYFRMEDAVAGALRERWPHPAEAFTLQLISMISINALRLAMEQRRRDIGNRPLAEHLRGAFALISRPLASLLRETSGGVGDRED